MFIIKLIVLVVVVGFTNLNAAATTQTNCFFNSDNFVMTTLNKSAKKQNEKILYIFVRNNKIVETKTASSIKSNDFTKGINKTEETLKKGSFKKLHKIKITRNNPEDIFNSLMKFNYNLSLKDKKIINVKKHNFTFEGVTFEICKVG